MLRYNLEAKVKPEHKDFTNKQVHRSLLPYFPCAVHMDTSSQPIYPVLLIPFSC